MIQILPIDSFENPRDFDYWARAHDGEYEITGSDVIWFEDQVDHD